MPCICEKSGSILRLTFNPDKIQCEITYLVIIIIIIKIYLFYSFKYSLSKAAIQQHKEKDRQCLVDTGGKGQQKLYKDNQNIHIYKNIIFEERSK